MKKAYRNVVCAGLIAAGLTVGGLLCAETPGAEGRPIVIVPVNDEIEEGLVHIVRRGIRVAERKRARALVLHMDTYGGKVKAAEEIMQALARVDVPTYTYVDTKAISAGALIAASTKYIYMAPQSQIGDAKLLQMSPIPLLGGAKEVDKAIQEKAYSAVRAMVRSACERNGHDWKLFEAMMHEELAITNVIEEGRLLTLTSNEAVTQGLAVAVVGNLDEMIEKAGLAGAPEILITPHSGERLARFFSSMMISGLLLLFGLGGLFIEVRTPGFGVPGIVGAVCLALFFWGHYTAHLTGWFPIALFVIGVLLLLVEVFVIPGFGVTGMSGIACMAAALILAMLDWTPGDWANAPGLTDMTGPVAVVAASIIGALALLFLMAKFMPKTPGVSRVFLAKSMDRKEGYVVRDAEQLHQWIHKSGVAKTTLRPAGKATIDGKLLDVVTLGDFVDPGTRVTVISTESNRIVVEPDEAPGPDKAT